MGKMRHYAGVALVVACAWYVLFDGIQQPYFNWDVVGYVASAYAAEGLQGAPLSRATYQDLRKATNPATFYQLARVDAPQGYRYTVYKDPRSLQQQLPFYRIRVLYVWLMGLLHRQGISFARATCLISAVCAAASLGMTGLLARSLGLDLLWVPFVGLGAGLDMLARLSTPDALACFAMLLGAWLFLQGRRERYLLAMILPAVRTDLLMLSVLMLCHDFWFDWKTAALAALAGSLGVYFAVDAVARNYGWLTLFDFQMMGITPYPASLRIDTSVADYVRVYQGAALGWLRSLQGLPFLLALRMVFVSLPQPGVQSRRVALVAMFTAYALLHYALFPLGELRFFTPSLIVVLLGLLAALAAPRAGQGLPAQAAPAALGSL